jgi:5'(3')-deoxyribonucleotidase
MSLVINVDSDGVVYDWHGYMVPFLSDALGVELDRNQFTEWDLAKAVQVSKAKFYELFEQAVNKGAFRKGEPLPGAIEGLKKLMADGHRVRIVTSKILRNELLSEWAMVDTVTWYYGIQCLHGLELVFTSGSRKVDYKADVVIDDKPDFGWVQDEAYNLLFDQPWNRSVTAVYNHAFRVDGWEEILDMVESIVVAESIEDRYS